jgi:hypothetical protein
MVYKIQEDNDYTKQDTVKVMTCALEVIYPHFFAYFSTNLHFIPAVIPKLAHPYLLYIQTVLWHRWAGSTHIHLYIVVLPAPGENFRASSTEKAGEKVRGEHYLIFQRLTMQNS